MDDPIKINAPFTPQQVEAINLYQRAGVGHPLTCGSNRSDQKHRDYADACGGDLGELVARTEGLICPTCGYTQDWAWNFMAEICGCATTATRTIHSYWEEYAKCVYPDGMPELQQRELEQAFAAGAQAALASITFLSENDLSDKEAASVLRLAIADINQSAAKFIDPKHLQQQPNPT